MEKIFILCGPQGIGKTAHAPEISFRLGCTNGVDDWNGIDPLPLGTLAITNAEYTMPHGAVAFHVEDEAGLDALIHALRDGAS